MKGFYLIVGVIGTISLIAEIITMINFGFNISLGIISILTLIGTILMFYSYWGEDETYKIKR